MDSIKKDDDDDDDHSNQSGDIKCFDNSLSDAQEKLPSSEYFYLQVRLLKKRPDRILEEVCRHQMKLEDMINLSVFHLHGFNHYVTQVNDQAGFDIYINSHQMGLGLFA